MVLRVLESHLKDDGLENELIMIVYDHLFFVKIKLVYPILIFAFLLTMSFCYDCG